MKKYLLFRNDDVRESLDNSLIEITDLFIKYNIPITHAIEPGNITSEVANWLIKKKKKYPDLIEIIQHGYKHKLNINKYYGGKKRKGEFGPGRSYYEQYYEIKKGKNIMDKYFGDLWFPSFTFPYGGKNNIALQAVNDVGFKSINDHRGVSLKHKLFYLYGHVFRINFIKGYSVSYHLKKRPRTNLFNIDMNMSIIKKYYNEKTSSEMFPIDQIIKKIEQLKNEKTIGIILHHRYHNSKEKIALIENLLSWCKNQPNFVFTTQENIYHIYSK